jgi:CBS domain-containing protein
MKTRDLCSKDVVAVPGTTKLDIVAKAMRHAHVGSVVVIGDEGRKPIGMLTDRDIVLEVVAMGLDPRTVAAAEVMTTSPVVTGADDDALWALKTMRDRGVRRLPVVDEKGELAGMLAFDDLIEVVGTTLGDIAQVIGTERNVEAWRRH